MIKSNGGSSDYYKISLLSSITNSEVSFELEDYLRDALDNQWDLCNITKACRRISQARNDKGKDGTSEEYDLNKIIWFANQRLKYLQTTKELNNQ